jgi:hypothetical protein
VGVSRVAGNPSILEDLRGETILRGTKLSTGCARKPKCSVKSREKAIKCENISPDILIFDGLFGSESDILNPRWRLTGALQSSRSFPASFLNIGLASPTTSEPRTAQAQ